MSSFRRRLQSVVNTTSGPYGYTLTVWGAGAVSLQSLGSPGLLGILLFAGGAIAAFVVLELVAYGAPRLRPERGSPPVVSTIANAHWLSVGAGVLAAWALDRLISGTGAWSAAGFAATAVYLGAAALQATLAGLT
jgi:hypothetical protein